MKTQFKKTDLKQWRVLSKQFIKILVRFFQHLWQVLIACICESAFIDVTALLYSSISRKQIEFIFHFAPGLPGILWSVVITNYNIYHCLFFSTQMSNKKRWRVITTENTHSTHTTKNKILILGKCLRSVFQN